MWISFTVYLGMKKKADLPFKAALNSEIDKETTKAEHICNQ